MNNLPELRDIHLPEKISLFPLGYGAVFLMALLVCAVLLWPYFRHLYLQSKKKYAFDFLGALTQKNMASVCKISELLRRICKIKHKKAVALYGTDWADFLNQTAKQKLPKQQMTILINAPYALASSVLSDGDFSALKNFAKDWVESNL